MHSIPAQLSNHIKRTVTGPMTAFKEIFPAKAKTTAGV